jgi:hypothetical protein
VTAQILPLPYVRKCFREAQGHLLSGDAAPASLRDTAMRFLRGLPPEVRRQCSQAEAAARRLRAANDAGDGRGM